MRATSVPHIILMAVASACLPARLAFGDVLRFEAALDAQCQELVAGLPVSFDQSFEEFEVTTFDLPIRAASGLRLLGPDGALAAAAQGFADFSEPLVEADRNPAELALEANCFSIDPEVSHQVVASVLETRTIRFNRSELRTPDLDVQDVISSVFLSGAIVVWLEDPTRDLHGLTGQVEFTVDQIRTVAAAESGEPAEQVVETVFRTVMGVTGVADGVVQPFIEGVGTFVFGGPELVRELAGPDPPPGDFDLMGNVWVLLIPIQELSYQYPARPREQFDLVASFSVEVANLPGGTGVSAVFGRDFEALRILIEEAFIGADGEATQAAVNLALAKARAPQSVPAATDAVAAAPAQHGLCGAVGGEGMAMLLLAGVLPAQALRRRI